MQNLEQTKNHPNPSTFRTNSIPIRKGVSQAEIARQLGISRSYLNMILAGQRNPNAQLRDRLCSLGLLTTEANLSLRGRCPRPLDECATLTDHSGHISYSLRFGLVPRLRRLLGKSNSLSPQP